MALHEKDKVRDSLLDDVYASTDLSVSMPKYKFPPEEHLPRHAYQVVHDELMMDGNARQNLATFDLFISICTFRSVKFLLLCRKYLNKYSFLPHNYAFSFLLLLTSFLYQTLSN